MFVLILYTILTLQFLLSISKLTLIYKLHDSRWKSGFEIDARLWRNLRPFLCLKRGLGKPRDFSTLNVSLSERHVKLASSYSRR